MVETVANFKVLKYFRSIGPDQWGDPTKMSLDLLLNLDHLRAKIGSPIYVTSGYRAQSRFGVNDSEHLRGKAVDVVCPALQLMDFYLAAERIPAFHGIGIYPDWMWDSRVVGGLHLDIRDLPARWMGVSNPVTGQSYVALSKENLKRYGVV